MSHFNVADDESLDLPPMLPTVMPSELSPSDGSVNVLDMINQDIMLGDSLQSTSNTDCTEVTFASQYAAASVAPFTSAGDVFLPSIPITTISNTFVKPTPFTRTAKTILTPNPRSANPTPSNSCLIDPLLHSQRESLKNPFASTSLSQPAIFQNTSAKSHNTHEKSRNTSAKSRDSSDKSRDTSAKSCDTSAKSRDTSAKLSGASAKSHNPSSKSGNTSSKSRNTSSKSHNTSSRSSSKKSSSRSHSHSHSATKSSSCSKSARRESSSARTRTTERSLLLNCLPTQSAFVPASRHHHHHHHHHHRGNTVRSTAVTHTVTRAADTVTNSPVTFATEMDTYTTTTVVGTVSGRVATDAWSSLITGTVTSKSATRAQSPVTGMPVAYATIVHSDSSTTSSLIHARSRRPMTIISPVQSTYTSLPASMLYSTPTIISRTLPAAGARARPAEVSPASGRPCEQFAIIPPRTAFVIPAGAAARTLPTTISDAPPQSRGRLLVPATNTYAASSGMCIGTTAATAANTTVTKTRVVYSTVTAPTTAASRTVTESTFPTAPGATLLNPKMFPSARASRSRTVAATTEPQSFTIVEEKGSYTTLISSDLTSTTCCSLVVSQAQILTDVNAGVGSHPSLITSDSMSRSRSQLLIPIPNSQTSTSLSYLVTSPIGSDVIYTRSSAGSTQSVTTCIGSHTIATISSEAFNRIRSRLLIPVSNNAPSTAADSLPASTIATDPNRTRSSVTIVTNRLISSGNPRDGSETSTTPSPVTTSTRTLFSRAPMTNPFAITSNSSSNRLLLPVMSNIHATSNSQSSAQTGAVTASRAFSATPTPGTYIIATGMQGSSTSPVREMTTRPSRVLLMHNSSIATAALTSTTVATTTARAYPGAASGSTSSIGPTEPHSMLRSRLIVQESSIPDTTTSHTAFAIARSCAPQSASYAFPAGPSSYTSSTKSSEVTTRNPSTITLFKFGPTLITPATTSEARSPLVVRGDSPSTLCSMTTATPTLANTGNLCVIKLATSPGASTATTASSVTTALTTPITTAALSPSEHHFLEPHPVSRPRTFPGPRTYSHRSATGNAQKRPSPVRNVTRTTPKRVVTSPAPLQIFADVVCPPTTAQSQTTATMTLGNSKPQFTLSQYKSPATHTNPQRHGSRCSNQRMSSDRLLLNRSLTMPSSRRLSSGAHSVAQVTPTTSTVTQRACTHAQPEPETYREERSQASRATPIATDSDFASMIALHNTISIDDLDDESN